MNTSNQIENQNTVSLSRHYRYIKSHIKVQQVQAQMQVRAPRAPSRTSLSLIFRLQLKNKLVFASNCAKCKFKAKFRTLIKFQFTSLRRSIHDCRSASHSNLNFIRNCNSSSDSQSSLRALSPLQFWDLTFETPLSHLIGASSAAQHEFSKSYSSLLQTQSDIPGRHTKRHNLSFNILAAPLQLLTVRSQSQQNWPLKSRVSISDSVVLG